jgi:putative phosphoesterase
LRVGLISDTHAPRFWKALPPRVAAAFDGVEAILHAGDVCTPDVLEQLGTIAPVRCARGNNDPPDLAPTTVELTLATTRIVVVHETGPATGRMPRLRKRHAAADLVVFGHSHIPWDETCDGLRALNPGSPTDKRRQAHGTVMVLDLPSGRVQLVEVT